MITKRHIQDFLAIHNSSIELLALSWEGADKWNETKWLNEFSKRLNIPLADLNFLVQQTMLIPELHSILASESKHGH